MRRSVWRTACGNGCHNQSRRNAFAMKFFYRAAWVTTVALYFLIALGGTVLVTESGLTCATWLLCSPQTPLALFEQAPRFTIPTVGTLLGLLLIGAGLVVRTRKDRALLTMAIVAPVLLGVQRS